jgi:hypothetical protein
MSNFSLFTQIGMIVVAGTIMFTYIKPTYNNIQIKLDTIETYKTEADKVKDVDDLLVQKVNTVDGVSAADTAALKRYVPDSVDDVAVMKDIQSIFTALALPLSSIAIGGTSPVPVQGVSGNVGLMSHSFSISTKVSYDELKTLLKVIEVNNYLLQVNSLTIAPAETGSLGVSMTLTTFNRATTTPSTDASASQ